MWKNIIVLIILALLITACEFSWDWLEDLEGEDMVPCDSNALIDAINDANDTPNTIDTINLDLVCFYELTEVDNTTEGYNGLPSIISPIVINGNGATIHRSSAAGTPEFRIFYVAAEGSLTLNYVTLSNGYVGTDTHYKGTIGGAILNLGSLTITNSSFSGNSAFDGGGAIADYQSAAPLIITSTNFITNHAGTKGGAIFNEEGVVSVTESTFSGNDARSGGAVFTMGPSTINSSVFTGNHAEKGGAIKNLSDMIITSSSIVDNQAVHGGGIYNSTLHRIFKENSITITNSTIAYNIAGFGSGIYNNMPAVVYIINSTFSGNSPSVLNSGGVIHNTGIVYISYSTITNNQTTGLSSRYISEVTNSIIANNPGLDCSILIHHAFTVLGTNLDSDGSCLGFTITTDPLLGPLADNGGPTQTHALSFGSPAIDAATGSCPGGDQRGEARPYGSACDLGAYEAASFFGFIASSTFCYYSPDPTHVAAHSLSAGTEVEVAGYSEDLSYVAVVSPRNPDLTCYVDKDDLTLPDPLPYLPVLPDPPPPIDLPDPGEDSPDEPQACHSGLSGAACVAAGGVWNISTNPPVCVCP